MALTFADTHNMIAYLTKSDASKGFDQIINFLYGSSIRYALTVNPNIYVSCIKQFWTSVSVNKVNDVLRLQALVDKKRVIITEATIRDALRLDNAEGIDCLPNEEIFTELARMGYEKPSIKLAFYKAFFSSQWKVETPLFEGMLVAQQVDESAADLNDDDVPNAGVADEGAVDVNDVPDAVVEPPIPSPTLSTQPPPPSQDIPSTFQVQPTQPPSLIAQPPLPHQQLQPLQDAEISMNLLHNLLDTCTTLTRRLKHLEQDMIAQSLEITKLKQRVQKLERRNKLKRRMIADMDADVDVTLKDVVDIAKEVVVDAEIKEGVDVQRRQADAARRRTGVGIRDPKEIPTPSTIIHTEAKSKDKGKGILVEEPKPLKKQAQIEHVEAYARELKAELNKNIDWDEVIDHVQRKEKEDNAMKRYQALKRKPQTEAQARKNMLIYLRNVARFKMDYFKGMTYDDIRLIFEKKFNSNVAFLQKIKEQMEEEDSSALKRLIPNDDDDVYTEATPLAHKVPVVDYEIYTENNKPYYKIIRADGSLQLFLSFLSLLRNFNREDLEVLWELVKERFASSKPKNFSDDFLPTTLTYMFKKPNVQAQVWKNQRTVHGLVKVKIWKLLESCRVYIITFTSTQMILLVDKRYPLTRFTLD
nr:hypothetical protein [Tanacetum cinerariifolium]